MVHISSDSGSEDFYLAYRSFCEQSVAFWSSSLDLQTEWSSEQLRSCALAHLRRFQQMQLVLPHRYCRMTRPHQVGQPRRPSEGSWESGRSALLCVCSLVKACLTVPCCCQSYEGSIQERHARFLNDEILKSSFQGKIFWQSTSGLEACQTRYPFAQRACCRSCWNRQPSSRKRSRRLGLTRR